MSLPNEIEIYQEIPIKDNYYKATVSLRQQLELETSYPTAKPKHWTYFASANSFRYVGKYVKTELSEHINPRYIFNKNGVVVCLEQNDAETVCLNMISEEMAQKFQTAYSNICTLPIDSYLTYRHSNDKKPHLNA